MINRIILPLICLLICCACNGYKEARQISRHSPRDYTGIDTLIRIDGYYYGLCKVGLCSPFMLSENGKYTGRFGIFDTHDRITADFYKFYHRIFNGQFQVDGDTITVNTTRKYSPWSYDLIKYVFVIVNDTTLERVYFSYKRVDTKENFDRVLFRFYEYPIENFK